MTLELTGRHSLCNRYRRSRDRVGLSRRRDRVVGLEEVARVIQRLDLAQALPGGGVVEGARVGRLLHEVGVVAGLEALRGELDRRQRPVDLAFTRVIEGDAEREQGDLAGKRCPCARRVGPATEGAA